MTMWGIRFRACPLKKAQRKRADLEKLFDPLITKAEKNGDHEEREKLIGEYMMETDFAEEEIGLIITRSLKKEAERLNVPTPSGDDSFKRGPSGRYFLNVKAQAQLRDDIRKERRERRDWITRYLLPVITALTGILGALIGLVAVWGN